MMLKEVEEILKEKGLMKTWVYSILASQIT